MNTLLNKERKQQKSILKSSFQLGSYVVYYLFSHSTNLQILAKKLTKNQASQKMYSVYSLKDADAVIQYLFKSGLLLISATLEQSKSSAGKA